MHCESILAQLTLEEKASLCSGADSWHTKAVERLGVEPIMMSDGPHGMRTQFGNTDHLGIHDSEPATCFPTASATAASFDPALLEQVGGAIGAEAAKLGVSLVLGPGTNIKRHPMCGRNFEYFSEDPCLAGKLSAGFIRGVQSQNVGTCLKHFAANNQERARFVNNSVIDERTLREIYLTAFETAVKESKPWSLMCSYNVLNGQQVSQNGWLLSKVLREEWGFTGAVISDWGAVDDRPAGIAAGLDLEMPFLGKENDEAIVAAVRSGKLSMEALDACVLRVLQLIEKGRGRQERDISSHHALARRASEASAVLLKNEEGLLPLSPKKRLAVIGGFAEKPRYQGAGSSHINPFRLDVPLEELNRAGFETVYARGYEEEALLPDETLIAQAAAAAGSCDCAVVFAGLPDSRESEGYDRSDMSMPRSHTALIEAVAQANPNTVVVLMCGSPVEMPWRHSVKAILLMYLGGEAVGSACANLLCGKAVPGGKLAETWPEKAADVASDSWFARDTFLSEYRERMLVGYRWFDTAKRVPAYPFGYGLSYTSFSLKNIRLEGGQVKLTVSNTGSFPGSEVVQVYVHKPDSRIFRADKELKAFQKVFLAPGEERELSLQLEERAFCFYDVHSQSWVTEAGSYELLVGSSSRDIAGVLELTLPGVTLSQEQIPNCYASLPAQGALEVPAEEFRKLFPEGYPVHPRQPKPYHRNSVVAELQASFLGRVILKAAMAKAKDISADDSSADMVSSGMYEFPFRAIPMSGLLTPTQINGLIDLLNGHPVSGVKKLMSKFQKEGGM